MKYRRKEIVDAIQFDEESPQIEVKYFMICDSATVDLTGKGNHIVGEVKHIPHVDTYEYGWSRIKNGDYIVTDAEGHVLIMDGERFESLYEIMKEN